MAKIITIEEAASMVKDGMSVMVSGFWGVGAPDKILHQIAANGTKNLTAMSISASMPGRGSGILIDGKCVSKFIASFVGRNKEAAKQMEAGELEVEFTPQGTLAERCRAGGFGLGGILTPTSLGTELGEGKPIIEVDGKKYVLETALKADFALIKANKADKAGNLIYHKATRNTNPLMAPAGKITICQVDEIVEIGEMDPNDVMTPGVFVDYLVQS
jgi:acetate CoA/acetoacetate CoA-transferase alpha subunit